MFLFMKLIVLLVVLTVCNPAAVIAEEGTEVQDLKDLLIASVENVVALNTLVTSQTQRISELMLTMSSNKMQIDDMKKEFEEKLKKLEAKNQEFEVKNQEFEANDQEFEEKNLEFTAKLQELEEKDDECEDKVEGLEAKDQEFEQKLQELEVKDQEFEAMDQELKSEIDHYGNPVTVLNGEEGTGNSQCAKVCSGTTGRTSSNWSRYSSVVISMTVDISGCGFTKIPTITTSLEQGNAYGNIVEGGSKVRTATSTQFSVWIYRKGGISVSTAASYKFNMEWIAVGFTC